MAKVTIEVYGPDPLGSAIQGAHDQRLALELGGSGAPASVRVGMSGDPSRAFAGDLGPLQRFGGGMTGTAQNLRGGPAPAMPSSTGPAASSTKSNLLSGTGLL